MPTSQKETIFDFHRSSWNYFRIHQKKLHAALDNVIYTIEPVACLCSCVGKHACGWFRRCDYFTEFYTTFRMCVYGGLSTVCVTKGFSTFSGYERVFKFLLFTFQELLFAKFLRVWILWMCVLRVLEPRLRKFIDSHGFLMEILIRGLNLVRQS